MYIDSWNEVPDGSEVIQDTYNEVYTISTNENYERVLTQIGWQVGDKPVPESQRVIDFEPDCPYDQPWLRIN